MTTSEEHECSSLLTDGALAEWVASKELRIALELVVVLMVAGAKEFRINVATRLK